MLTFADTIIIEKQYCSAIVKKPKKQRKNEANILLKQNLDSFIRKLENVVKIDMSPQTLCCCKTALLQVLLHVCLSKGCDSMHSRDCVLQLAFLMY